MLAAVIDTCVLYSGLRRDFLLPMAAMNVFRVVISDDLLFEISYVEERKHVWRRRGAARDGEAAPSATTIGVGSLDLLVLRSDIDVTTSELLRNALS